MIATAASCSRAERATGSRAGTPAGISICARLTLRRSLRRRVVRVAGTFFPRQALVARGAGDHAARAAVANGAGVRLDSNLHEDTENATVTRRHREFQPFSLCFRVSM